MKFFPLITLIFITALEAVGQDCKTLNDFNSFHGLKFGQQFTDSIKQYFDTLEKQASYIDYSLDEKKLENKIELFNKFYKWFYFGETFSTISVSCLSDGRIFEFSLFVSPRGEDSIAAVNNKVPPIFIKISDEISSLFGKMTNSKNENTSLGHSLSRIWECEKNKVDLTLYYDNQYSNSAYPLFTLMIDLSITNKDLEKTQKLKGYQE